MRDVIPDLVAWAVSKVAIRAVLITSTRAIPTARVDQLSDYDVILVVDDIQPFVDDHAWLGDFGEVLVGYWDQIHQDPQYGVNVCGNVIQFCDGLKIDFTLWPVGLLQQIVAAPRLPAELDAGYRILLDKDNLTSGMPAPTGLAYIPKKPSKQEYLMLINDFLSDAPYVAKCLWRGELLPAKWCLDFDMKHVYLRQALEWHLEIDHGWSVPVGVLGKGLKHYLPPDIYSALEQTYTGAGTSSNWDALSRTMDLFRRISVEVGRALGYDYPHELHTRVTDFVGYIQSARFLTQE